MGASIHINGTGSSIVDSIFVCRSMGSVPKKWLVDSASGFARLVLDDLTKIEADNIRCSAGDIRCITYGHLIRMAIWSLHSEWDKKLKTEERINRVYSWIQNMGGWPEVEKYLLSQKTSSIHGESRFVLNETGIEYGEPNEFVSF